MNEKDERERARRLGNHLGEIIARLVNEKAELTADRDKWRDRCERLIAASRHWDSAGKAKAIQKEIDDDTN